VTYIRFGLFLQYLFELDINYLHQEKKLFVGFRRCFNKKSQTFFGVRS